MIGRLAALFAFLMAAMPAEARFLSTDPIGYQDQINQYAYVGNDPVNHTDPTGEESACISFGNCGLGSPGGDAFVAKAAGIIADFTPGVGDIKGAIEFAQNPTVIGGIAVTVGVIPLAGDLVSGALRGGGDALSGTLNRTSNAAGGDVFTFSGDVNSTNVAGAVNSAMAAGHDQINILSGVHGLPGGGTMPESSFFDADVKAFGGMDGVTVHDFSKMSPNQISNMINGPGATIGAFCNSGDCLKPD